MAHARCAFLGLRLLLDLWKEVSIFGGQVGLSMLTPLPGLAPSPLQLYGIEINDYAHELAQATVWIGYLQWLHGNGFGFPEEPILKPLDNIRQMDAILAYDGEGRPVEPEWPAAEVIVGNPPFLGDKRMRGELGDKYVDELRALYSGRVYGGAGLVTYWFEHARKAIETGKTKAAGLLATNSVRQPGNRWVLDRIKQTGDIFWAMSDRPCILDGAAVRVSMVGFDDGSEIHRQLDGQTAQTINADLTSAADATRAQHLEENKGLCFLGMMKAGPFDIDSGLALEMLANKDNPNGCPNSDVVKRRLVGQNITGRPADTWVIDFGVSTPLDVAAGYIAPFEYVRQHVKPVRDLNRRARMKEKWWLFGEARPGLRRSLANLDRCIITPEVAKNRIFVWMGSNVVPDHTLHVIARSDDYMFGILHSRAHEV